jgi:hypothetical protein
MWSSSAARSRQSLFQLEGPKVESINIEKLVEKLSGTKDNKPDYERKEVQKLYVCLEKGCEDGH